MGRSLSDTATVTGLVDAPHGYGDFQPVQPDHHAALYRHRDGEHQRQHRHGHVRGLYRRTATGTDYWVATFNGDSNNDKVTSGATAEPVNVDTITTGSDAGRRLRWADR